MDLVIGKHVGYHGLDLGVGMSPQICQLGDQLRVLR